MLLFLGSGVSRASGLPGVKEITNRILNDACDSDAERTRQYRWSGHDKHQSTGLVRKAQRLLRLLAQIDEHYRISIAPSESGGQYRHTGSIYRQDTTYEDLFYLAEQIRDCCVGLTDEAPVGAFVDIVEQRAGDLLESENRDARIINMYHLAAEAVRYIEWAVADSLQVEHVTGLDLIVELARSDQIDRLDIITLNHDTLVETLLAEKNINVADGFGAIDGDVRWHDDRVYDADNARVRLVKLHGSINWYKFRVSDPQLAAIMPGADPLQCHDANGRKLESALRTPSFLSGVNKILAYNKGVYADVFFRFHQFLREHRTIIMSGYGWADTAINFRLENWLDRDRHNTIILLHKNPESLMKRSLLLDSSYQGLVRTGRLIPLDQWLGDTSHADLNRALACSGEASA